MSGFQALISSTSSASFGRHGSEKAKHKKHKKQNYDSIKGDKVKCDSIKETDKQSTTKTESTKSSRVRTKKEKVDIEIQHSDSPTSVDERPKSATDFKFSLKDRKTSLSETRTIDKCHFKGKSMPSLHLIDLNKGSFDEFIKSKKYSSAHLIPEVGSRSPNKAVVIDNCHNVPFPIITITEHSPVASINFFNSDSESKKVQQCRSPSKYKFFIENDFDDAKQSISSIVRSKSDTEINYSIETSGESLASINYVTKNGRLSPVVILKAVHSIILKDSVCSIRICKIIFNILNKLLSFKIITKQTGRIYESKFFFLCFVF